MKTIIGLGVLSFLASLTFLAFLLGRTALMDNFYGTDLIYPIVGFIASWVVFLSCASFVMIRRARKKVNLWPAERRMYSLTTAKMAIVLYDLIERGAMSVKELQNNPEFLAILYEYLDYKKNGGRDEVIPGELRALFRTVATDISVAGKEK
ncbi:MAG TPA: hypothetical protein VJH25_02195 [Candidatus Paceibacterota bacterium]